MTDKEFMNNLANAKADILQEFIDLITELKIGYCLIGGLAVNAYAEPVVSLDLDIVVSAEKIDEFIKSLEKMFTINKYSHSINLNSPDSDLRIQIQTDSQYQNFIQKAELKTVMGYELYVACLEDVLKGKIWAYTDETRRKSKRQKDLADIYRLVEAYPHLKNQLPPSITLEQ